MTRITLLVLALSSSLAGCSDDGNSSGPDGDTLCTTLTYANFAQTFFAENCTVCHATDAVDRQGATAGKNWDVLAIVQENANSINFQAGMGTTMPPSFAPAFPLAADRAKLSEWIGCGAP